MRYPIRSEDNQIKRIFRFVLGGMVVLMVIASVVGRSQGMLMFAMIGLIFAMKMKVFRIDDFNTDYRIQLSFDAAGFTIYRLQKSTRVTWRDVHRVTFNGQPGIKRTHYLVEYYDHSRQCMRSLVIDDQQAMAEKFGVLIQQDHLNASSETITYPFPAEKSELDVALEVLDGDDIIL